MAKDKKAIEKARQAKSLRLKARAKEKKQEAIGLKGPAQDDFEMFRRALTPDDLSPAIWNRRQTLQDLDGRRPGLAVRQFFSRFIDDEVMEQGGPSADRQMEWGVFVWRLATLHPKGQSEAIEAAAGRVSEEAEIQAKFKEDVQGLIELHRTMFPTLHAHLARLRALAGTNGAGSVNGAGVAVEDDATAIEAEPAERPTDAMMEFARPLLEAAGSDPQAIARALITASDLWGAAQAPIGQRMAMLQSLRSRMPEEEQADFDEISRIMLKRYREMFVAGTTTDERPTTNDGSDRSVGSDQSVELATAGEEQPEAEAEESEQQSGSLLGRWLRRRR